MSRNANPSPPAAGRLCPACGLCCNGVLFADVKVGPKDAPTVLASQGLPVRRAGGNCAFDQPCAALQTDGRCRVYADRPQMCRKFECGVLQNVQAGRLTDSGALRFIRQAQRLARKVAALLERCGDHETHRPLTKRYQAVMRQPIDLSAGDGAGDVRGELMLAVHELMGVLQENFLRADRPVRDAGDQEPV